MTDALNGIYNAVSGAGTSVLRETGLARSQAMPITVAPVINIAGVVDPALVRDEILPEIMQALDTGVRGFRQQLATMMQQTTAGVTAGVA